MKKTLTRVLSLTLVLIMALGVLPFASAAEGGFTVRVDAGDVTWTNGVASVTFTATLNNITADEVNFAWEITGGSAADKTGASCTVTTSKSSEITADVTVTKKNASSQTATAGAMIQITAPAQDVAVTATGGITVTPAAYKAGDTVTLTAATTFSPAEHASKFSNITYTWTGATPKTSGANTATVVVTEDPIVVTATPVVPAVDGYEVTPVAGTVTVAPKSAEKVQKIEIAAANLQPNTNQKSPITVTLTPANAEADITWQVTAENGKTGSVDSSNNFSGNKPGSYTVTAKAVAKGGSEADAVSSNSLTFVVKDAPYTLAMNKETADLAIGETVVLQPVLTQAETADPKAVIKSVEWSAGNAFVGVTAGDKSATIKGLKATSDAQTVTATVKVKIGDQEETKTLTAAVNVTDKVYIAVENASTSAGSYTLTPKLMVNGEAVDATFKFTGAAANDDNKSANVTGKNKVVEVTVNLLSAGDKVADPSEVKAAKARISFYTEGQYVKVQMKDDYTSFTFSDKEALKGSESLLHELLETTCSESLTQNLKFFTLSNAAGKIRPMGNYHDFTGDTKIAYGALGETKFTILDVDQKSFKVSFEWLDSGDEKLVYGAGTLEIVFGDALSAIRYTTTFNQPIQMNPRDFINYWDRSKMEGSASYVVFEDHPDVGTLYLNKKMEDKDKVTSTDKFNLSGKEKLLEDVTYKPAAAQLTYEDIIPFAVYGGKNNNDVVYGTLSIQVGSKMNFTDVKTSDWFYDYVVYVNDNGIMTGTSKTEFSPNAPLTRGMVVTMLYRMEKEPIVTKSGTFNDVPSGQWYSEAVEWAAANGIVTGYDARTFGPNNNITRQDLAVILHRYSTGYKSESKEAVSSLTRFVDYQKVADYAVNALEWASYRKIIGGDDAGKINPTGNATRAEAAKMFTVYLTGKN